MRLGRPAKVFLSYSHKDDGFLEDLRDNLATLVVEKLIEEPWWDRDIDVGGKWRSEILARLEEADLILLLLSPRFVASTFCREIELPRSRDLAAAGRIVVPVILDANVNLGPLGLAELQAVPDPKKPVSSYGNRTEAYEIVTDRLRRLLSGGPNANEGAAN
ncbi:toll/interleukin-1 receptor domain-containing protein, partial [Candidatus Accumulibacter vicinus]|uniref:toll/interleukin-1 receptor domain-containing protein n=1 Tax=Candidatus Accumulibacter vicinus TaxID=2954382 RepID=UPI00235B5E99